MAKVSVTEAFWQIHQYQPFEDFWYKHETKTFYGWNYNGDLAMRLFYKPEEVVEWIKKQPNLYKIMPKELAL